MTSFIDLEEKYEEPCYVMYHNEFGDESYRKFKNRLEAEKEVKRYERRMDDPDCFAKVLEENEYYSIVDREGDMPWEKPGMSVRDFF